MEWTLTIAKQKPEKIQASTKFESVHLIKISWASAFNFFINKTPYKLFQLTWEYGKSVLGFLYLFILLDLFPGWEALMNES